MRTRAVPLHSARITVRGWRERERERSWERRGTAAGHVQRRTGLYNDVAKWQFVNANWQVPSRGSRERKKPSRTRVIFVILFVASLPRLRWSFFLPLLLFFSLFSLFLSDSRVTRASERAGSVCKIVFTFERLKETRRVSLASSLKFHFHLANSSSIRVPIYLNHTLSEINYLPRVYDALFTAEKKSRKQGMPRIRPIERGNFHIYLYNLLKINQYIYVLFIVG